MKRCLPVLVIVRNGRAHLENSVKMSSRGAYDDGSAHHSRLIVETGTLNGERLYKAFPFLVNQWTHFTAQLPV